jgi:hypothetical protein
MRPSTLERPVASAAIALVALAVRVALAQPPEYLDDRSTPEMVLRSYANALSSREYARAYSYWEPAAAAAELGSFPDFAVGNADTDEVRLSIGPTTADVGAGQFFWNVAVVLDTTLTDATERWFVGCYTLHLARPEFQDAPPYRPLSIRSARVQEVASASEADAGLDAVCLDSAHDRTTQSAVIVLIG